MDKQLVTYKDLGIVDYKVAWDYQESLLLENVKVKAELTKKLKAGVNGTLADEDLDANSQLSTHHYLLFCEHPPVYTLGKSGDMKNILITEAEMQNRGIHFFKTNRGGDITFHGPQQIVGYPIIDLEKFYTDIGKYLRGLEEVIILTLADFGIAGERSKGETGVWIEPGVKGRERKICAMGVRCSRWITMHGFALNANTDLSYFDHIIPCGIENKEVTSMEKELNTMVDLEAVKDSLRRNFKQVFNVNFNS